MLNVSSPERREYHNIKTDHESLENVAKPKYLWTTLINEIFIHERAFKNMWNFKVFETTLTIRSDTREEFESRLFNEKNYYYCSFWDVSSSPFLYQSLKMITQNYNFTSGFIWMWNLVSCLKRTTWLRLFQNLLLRRIFGSKERNLTGGLKKFRGGS
jgi:hypothetical protein